MKTHSGEKLNKCNQCDYASSRADVLRTLLKAHNGEKSNKCNQCDFAPSLMTRLKTHSGGCRRFEEAENTRVGHADAFAESDANQCESMRIIRILCKNNHLICYQEIAILAPFFQIPGPRGPVDQCIVHLWGFS